LHGQFGLERLSYGTVSFRNLFLVIAEVQLAVLIAPTIDGGMRGGSAAENADEQGKREKKKLCVRHGFTSPRYRKRKVVRVNVVPFDQRWIAERRQIRHNPPSQSSIYNLQSTIA
jgi:hypothetical protein